MLGAVTIDTEKLSNRNFDLPQVISKLLFCVGAYGQYVLYGSFSKGGLAND